MESTAVRLAPGVTQLTDPMGVCMTLLEGAERALLVDTGYGLTDVREEVDRLIGPDMPRWVLLTHGHHDHALGAMRFGPGCWLFPEDLPVYETYTGAAQRRRVLDSALARGIRPPEGEAWLTLAAPATVPPPPEADLGGMRVRILKVPGHTPGSAVALVNDDILITGDDWNMTTWLFFPEALPAAAYREHMRQLLTLPFRRVICSHQPGLFPREALEAFVSGLTDEALRGALPCGEGAEKGIATRFIQPAEGQRFVFDGAKY